MTATGTRQDIRIHVLGPGDVPLVAELHVLTDVVEVWVSGRLDGTFTRTQVAELLEHPAQQCDGRPAPRIESTAVTMSLDLRGQLLIYLPGVPTWVRAPAAQQRLQGLL